MLNVTRVARNLEASPRFLGMELEDLLYVLGAATVIYIVTNFVAPHGVLFGLPSSIALSVGAFFAAFVALSALKYGKPRGHTKDLLDWYSKPRRYCCCEPDTELSEPYVVEEED